MAFRPEDSRPRSAPISCGSPVGHTCAGQGFARFHPLENSTRLTCSFDDRDDLIVIVSAESVLERLIVLVSDAALLLPVKVQNVA